MPNYIDTEKLYEFRKADIETNGYAANYVFGWNDAISKIAKDAPTADVAPVIHAHWKHVGTSPGVGMVYHCSRCERQVIVDYAFMLSQYPYCHCGAKMGKE